MSIRTSFPARASVDPSMTIHILRPSPVSALVLISRPFKITGSILRSRSIGSQAHRSTSTAQARIHLLLGGAKTRRTTSMMSTAQVQSSEPLRTSATTTLAVQALRSLYPEKLADRSWDNTGLLLESPARSTHAGADGGVLLTIDLTAAVAEEAVEKAVDLVVAYHPVIFRSLKSLTLGNSQQAALLRLAAAGISVYCPHTAVDAAVGGNADWLADCLTGEIRKSDAAFATRVDHRASERMRPHESGKAYSFHRFGPGIPHPLAWGELLVHPHRREPIVASAPDEASGTGRVVCLFDTISLGFLLRNLTSAMGAPPAIKVALPNRASLNQFDVHKFAVCAGSGGSVFSKIDEAKTGTVDLLVTGEMSHHEALAAVESGKAVVTLGHSDSERGYLAAVMKGKLEEAIRKILVEEKKRGKIGAGESIEVLLSDRDQDPFGTLMAMP